MGQRWSRKRGRSAASLPRAGLAGLLALAGCAPLYPPIAERGGDAAFKARIAETYRPGRRGADLRAELLREGFTLLADPGAGRYSALFEPSNLPCFTSVRIDWTEDRRGRIALIQAQRHPCS